MFRWTILTLLLFASHASAQTDPRRAEEQIAAALAKKDAAALERLLAPGFVMRGSPDVARATWLKNALTLCWGDRYEISELSLVRQSDDAAVITLLLTTYQDPMTCEPAIIRSLLTDLWVREDGRWRLALRHSAPPPAAVSGQFAKTTPPPPRWERSAELSFVGTGGNTDTQTLGAGASLVWRPGRWTTRGRAAYVRSVTSTAVTAESLVAEIRQSRALSTRADTFARLEYLVDRFAGIDNRLTVDAGLGWLLLQTGPHSVKVDAGFGGTREFRLTGETQAFASASTTAIYSWKLSPSTALNEQATLSADVTSLSNWRLQNALNTTAAMTRLFSVRISHELKRTNRPVEGFLKTDTVLSVALVARF
jgi:putative salt-induced outer membrane protein